jgi:SAM-dependent methyltransferase
VTNVESFKGEIEEIPLANQSVEAITSNCGINLSSDKDRVLTQAFRALKPCGRLAIFDVVIRGDLPAEIQTPETAGTVDHSTLHSQREQARTFIVRYYASLMTDLRLRHADQSDADVREQPPRLFRLHAITRETAEIVSSNTSTHLALAASSMAVLPPRPVSSLVPEMPLSVYRATICQPSRSRTVRSF